MSFITLGMLAQPCQGGSEQPASRDWSGEGHTRLRQQVQALRSASFAPGSAKNAILFVGDGMSLTTVTAARILGGQLQGATGEENALSFEHFAFTGLAKTYNTDAQTPDSAGTMTALITGHKTRAGVLGLDETGLRGDCKHRGQNLRSLFAVARGGGRATGVVTTARVTHATPAATYAHSPDRDWEAATPAGTGPSCPDIASQLVQHLGGESEGGQRTLDLMLGGGRRYFIPAPAGLRGDGRDLIAEWLAANPGAQVLDTRAALNASAKSPRLPIWGLFADSHMGYAQQPTASEPSLTEMTQAAIAHLKSNPKGYLLVVEAGRIDHAHHAGNAYNALHDTLALSQAVARAAKLTSPEDTLIVVTADHSHVMTLAGYPERGNPILGLAAAYGAPLKGADGKPYTTLSYANGPGFRDYGDEADADVVYARPAPPAGPARPNLAEVNTAAPGFHQESTVPLVAETHGGEDVPVYSQGPGAALLTGAYEQTAIYYVLEHALGLAPTAQSTEAKQ